MQCRHFQAGSCHSCALIETPYAEQVLFRQAACQSALAAWPDLSWDAPVTGPETAFRNKAKMAVGGTTEAPSLGVLDETGRGVDLRDCPLYPPAMQAAFAPIAEFIRELRIPPYDVPTRRGELKYILLTHAPHDDGLMLRFVLRSTAHIAAMREALPGLLSALPGLHVVSVNVQPEHKAILEGEEEIVLTGRTTLTMVLNDLPLHVRPRSFFQTNSGVAARLYATAREWVADIAPRGMWDLFCGVGGFALHCAPHVRGRVTGIEWSAEAIDSARRTAMELGLDNIEFRALDAAGFALDQAAVPELVLVNPPRRGIGEALCSFINASSARWLLYSSCNPVSLALDMARLTGFAPQRARMFDLFPHTRHCEVLVLLTRG
ncbi:MAG: 23S rRNA (uracil(747)-C(5))-methyltransferase RlmC [Pseudomonadota bacterium]